MTTQKPSPKAQKDKTQNVGPHNETSRDETQSKEIGGFGEKGNKLPEPTRFGDWEVKGRCSDF